MNAQIDVSSVVLKTNRLTLRPWRIEDLDDFFEYAKFDGVGQMAGWLPHETIENSKEILEEFIKGKKTFAIELDNKVIGSVGIEKYNEVLLPELNKKIGREIGYALSKEYWGKGIMTEAVNAVIKYLFSELKLDFIVCCYFTFNDRSKRVSEKCGFEYVRQYMYNTYYGAKHECNLTVLNKEKWLNYGK